MIQKVTFFSFYCCDYFPNVFVRFYFYADWKNSCDAQGFSAISIFLFISLFTKVVIDSFSPLFIVIFRASHYFSFYRKNVIFSHYFLDFVKSNSRIFGAGEEKGSEKNMWQCFSCEPFENQYDSFLSSKSDLIHKTMGSENIIDSEPFFS